MALITIRPSRGTVVFLVAVVATFVGRAAAGRHDAVVAVRDAPVAASARRLAHCLYGTGLERALGPRSTAARTVETWEAPISYRMRRIVSHAVPAGWPGRCSSSAENLYEQLVRIRAGARARQSAFEIRSLLATSPQYAPGVVAMVDDGRLGQLLARVLLDVSDVSNGTAANWYTPLGAVDDGLDAIAVDAGLDLRAGVADARVFEPITPDAWLVRYAGDDAVHFHTFRPGGARGGEAADRVVAYGTPVVARDRTGVLRVAGDAGDVLVAESARTPRTSVFPVTVREGRESASAWQLAGNEYLLTVDAGTVHVRHGAGPLGGVFGASTLVDLGEAGRVVGAVGMADEGGGALDVVAVRREATGVSAVRWHVVNGSGSPGGTATAVPLAHTEPVLETWSAYDPGTVSCVTRDHAFVLVHGQRSDDVVAVDRRGSVVRAHVDGFAIAWSGEAPRWDCNGDTLVMETAGDEDAHAVAVLRMDEAVGARAFGSTEAVAFALVPLPAGRFAGAFALGAGGVTVWMQSPEAPRATLSTVRAWQLAAGRDEWLGGTLLAELPLAIAGDEHATAGTLRVERVISSATTAAARVRIETPTLHRTVRAASRDDGRTWAVE